MTDAVKLPERIKMKNGRVFRLVMLRVTAHDFETDKPQDLSYIPDGSLVELAPGEQAEMIAAYFPEEVV
jgi:hypothetical protein